MEEKPHKWTFVFRVLFVFSLYWIQGPVTGSASELTVSDFDKGEEAQETLVGHRKYDLTVCQKFNGKKKQLPSNIDLSSYKTSFLENLRGRVTTALESDREIYRNTAQCITNGKSKGADPAICRCYSRDMPSRSYGKNAVCRGVPSFRDMETTYLEMRKNLALASLSIGNMTPGLKAPKNGKRSIVFGRDSNGLSRILATLPGQMKHIYFPQKTASLAKNELRHLRSRLFKVESKVIQGFQKGRFDPGSGKKCKIPTGLAKKGQGRDWIYGLSPKSSCYKLYQKNLVRRLQVMKTQAKEIYSDMVFSNAWLSEMSHSPGAEKRTVKNASNRRGQVAATFLNLFKGTESEKQSISSFDQEKLDTLILYGIPLEDELRSLNGVEQHKGCALAQTLLKKVKWKDFKAGMLHMGKVIGVGVGAGVVCGWTGVGALPCAYTAGAAATATDVSQFKRLNKKRNAAYRKYLQHNLTRDELDKTMKSVRSEKQMTLGMTAVTPFLAAGVRLGLANLRASRAAGGTKSTLAKTSWKKSMTQAEKENLAKILSENEGTKKAYDKIVSRMARVATQQALSSSKGLVQVNSYLSSFAQDRFMRSLNRTLGQTAADESLTFLNSIATKLASVAKAKVGTPAYKKAFAELSRDQSIIDAVLSSPGKGLADKFDRMVMSLRVPGSLREKFQGARSCFVQKKTQGALSKEGGQRMIASCDGGRPF